LRALSNYLVKDDMASLKYLWANRAKFPLSDTNFYKAWGKRIFSLQELISRNRKRNNLVKRGALIHEKAEIGEVQLEGNCRNLTVGELSFLGKVYIALHDKVVIGKRVCINDGVEILTASHDVSDPEWKQVRAAIIIEDYTWIGTGAMLLPGIRIGHGAVVGARAVVTKSVEPNTIVVGNPAKPTRKNRSSVLNYNPSEFLAANRAWLIG
jgi:acetyltransferase-like isoleucine patch superfamily enzyme